MISVLTHMYQTYIYIKKYARKKTKQNTHPPSQITLSISISISIPVISPTYIKTEKRKRKSEHTIYTYVFRPLIRKATLFAPYRTRGSLPSSSLPPSLPPPLLRSFVRMWYELRSDDVCNQTPIQSGLLSYPSPVLSSTPRPKKPNLAYARTPALIEENLRSITSILHQSFFRSKKVGGGRRGSPHREREWWEGEGGGASCIVKSKKKKKKKQKGKKRLKQEKKG